MVKTHRWLDLAEYASLLGLGVGTVASLVSAQLLYTSAPLSMLVLLNLANRKRLESATQDEITTQVQAVDQKVSTQVAMLNQQVSRLPTPEMITSLRRLVYSNDRELAENLATDLRSLQAEIHQRLIVMEAQSVAPIRAQVAQLQQRYQRLTDHINQVTAQWQDASNAGKIDALERSLEQLRHEAESLQHSMSKLSDYTKPSLAALQDQINHLNRQFQKLPPPFDATALQQKVSELIRLVSDLVPKREWLTLLNELQMLQQQQESQAQAEETLWRTIQDINKQLQNQPSHTSLTHLQQQINQLTEQVHQLPAPFDATSLSQEMSRLLNVVTDLVPRQDFGGLVAQVKSLQQQQAFQSQIESMLQSELNHINRQLRLLLTEPTSSDAQPLPPTPEPPEPTREFSQRLEQIVQREFAQLQRQLQGLPQGQAFQQQLEATVQRELLAINQQLLRHKVGPQYEFVVDFASPAAMTGQSLTNGLPSSRTVLEAALEQSQERLVLVLPWLNHDGIDHGLVSKMQAFLAQGKRLDLGWCHHADRTTERFLAPINQRWQIYPLEQSNLHHTLKTFLELKRSHPNALQFKILGTRENFLVADRAYAVLGVDEALAGMATLPNMTLKLKTTDSELVQQLIHQFDEAALNPDDVAAHWNRAVTRYDLGDRDGALADFNHIVGSTPHDAIAYNFRGIVRYDLGDRDGALADFQKSIQLDSRQVSPYCNRAYLRLELGDRAGAIADLSVAIQAQPRAAIAYFFRGMVLQQQENLEHAIADYNEALRLAPNSASAYYYRGLARPKRQDYQGAIADLEMALDLFTQRGHEANARKAFNSLQALRQALSQVPASAPASHSSLGDLSPFSLPDSVSVYEANGTTATPSIPSRNGTSDPRESAFQDEN
ncbi:tetratricopeptide repeat protein [Leptolyngbya sp. AN02str]|uniref:tetratricopeptide repeat protein n=1 Tax=Leptolyngbya sp. AN02str TaxID=3423363 RepID=UPI003D313E85